MLLRGFFSLIEHDPFVFHVSKQIEHARHRLFEGDDGHRTLLIGGNISWLVSIDEKSKHVDNVREKARGLRASGLDGDSDHAFRCFLVRSKCVLDWKVVSERSVHVQTIVVLDGYEQNRHGARDPNRVHELHVGMRVPSKVFGLLSRDTNPGNHQIRAESFVMGLERRVGSALILEQFGH